jgi:alpha-beta hydrolase superfamily lysophospholipase
MERLGLLLHRASDGRLAPHFGAGPFSWPLLENPQSCDQGHTTARRRAVSGGPRRAFPPRAEALCGRRHAWGVPPFTLHFSPDFFSCVAVFAGGADRLATAAAATSTAWRCWRRCAALRRGLTVWSPSGATQRYVGRGRSGSARLALETALITRRRHNFYVQP